MNPCNQSSSAVNFTDRQRLLLLLVSGLLGLLALSTVGTSSANAWPSVEDQVKKACQKKKGKAKKACIKQKTQQLNRTKGDVGVMTRNLYLGADLGPAIRAGSLEAFTEANGEILREVDTNNFPVRARGLAAEIIGKSPDLVGLQEVAFWRTGESGRWHVKPADPPDSFLVRTEKYDFLKLLLAELNKGKDRYEVVKETIEFDFEGPANYDGDAGKVPEINGRLTMRDVILAKTGDEVNCSNAQGGNYDTIFAPKVGGLVDVTVDRGWNSADCQVRNAPPFRFVNTHLEAFGDDKNKVVDCMTSPAPQYSTNQVSIRCSQAKELFEVAIDPSDLPVVAVGDFNSDDVSVVDDSCPSPANLDGTLLGNNGGLCGDTFAYNALKTLGMRNVSTYEPMSCCVSSSILTADRGSRDDFDHHIDHILTREADKVAMLESSVTGLKPVNGYWNSDHAGVYSKLRIQP